MCRVPVVYHVIWNQVQLFGDNNKRVHSAHEYLPQGILLTLKVLNF